MTSDNTALGPDEPGADWMALEAEILAARAVEPLPAAPAPEAGPEAEPGDDDAEAAAQAEAERQHQRWSAATYQPGPASAAVAGDEDEEGVLEPLSWGLKWVVGGVILAVLALAVLGFVVSFDTQTTAVEPFFGEYAPLVPLAIDLGIVVFAALNLVLARLNMSLLWLRAVPWVLTAMTLYINLSAHHELVARVAHVALPGMWIIASEVGTHVLRIRAGLEAGTRTESLGLVRWLLAPVTTARLWRHMRLWGLTTAESARETESQRLEARAALRFRYGLLWRATTPIQLKTAYRLRRLTAESVYTWTPPAIVDPAPEDTVKDTSEDTTKDSAKDTSEDAVKDTSEDASEDAAKDGARDAGGTGAKRSRRPRKDTTKPRRSGKAVDPKTASDDELAAHLAALVGPDERVSIRRAVTELSIGKARAARVLQALAALRADATV